MRRHQNLTGAVNPGNHCFSVGSIASFTFWAYGSGCDLVILGVDLQPIHIIPGHTKGYKLIICLDCSNFSGKVAASYGNDVIIYRPKLVNGGADAIPVFTWVEESVISLEECMYKATVLSWASTGKKILIGCSEILLWGAEEDNQHKETKERSLKVHFSIDESADEEQIEQGKNPDTSSQSTGSTRWVLLWRSGMRENLQDVQFSPDDELFASISQGESLLKVWHKRTVLAADLTSRTVANGTSQCNDTESTTPSSKEEWNKRLPSDVDYTFLYLNHPRPVVGFSWRKSVPLLPSGTIPNILISSCVDNICRVWCETLTPEADVRTLSTWYPTSHQRAATKKKIPHERTGTMEANFRKSISTPALGNDGGGTSTLHNLEKPAKRLFRHFHIAATINPVSDIPLLPSMSSSPDYGADGSLYFTVHWLDNKHHHAMSHLNKILHGALTETMGLQEDAQDYDSDVDSTNSRSSASKTSLTSSPVKRPSSFATKLPVWDSSKLESVDTYLSCFASPVSPEIQSLVGLSLPDNVNDLLRQDWLDQADALFAIHPTDGSLLVWHLSHLDENRCGKIRQTQVSFSSRIPMAIPTSDASTLSSRMVLYANHYSAHLSFNDEAAVFQKPQQPSDNEGQACNAIMSEAQTTPSVNLISKHSDGSLNHWEILFSSTAGYSAIASITHRLRFCGHRYHMTGIFCHPMLPLLATTSHHRHQMESIGEYGRSVGSELILWRVDPVGALCHSGGIGELARMNGSHKDDFKNVTWLPTLFPSWCLGPNSASPSTCLISLHESSLKIYQVVIDATQLLGIIPEDVRHCSQTQIGHVASQQSSRHPGCLLLLESLHLDEECNSSDILLLSIFNADRLDPKDITSQSGAKKGHEICETYFIVLVTKRKAEASTQIVAKTWKVSFNCSLESVVGAKSSHNSAFGACDSSDDESDSDYTPDNAEDQHSNRLSYLDLSARLINLQVLSHPEEAVIVTACSASDPLSSSIVPHSLTPPFTMLTVDEVGHVYFWTMVRSYHGEDLIEWVSCNDFDQVGNNSDKNTIAQSRIVFTGRPLVVKMAHSCMLACLSVVSSGGKALCFVSVYECLSSGGSFWYLQDKFFVGKVEQTSSYVEEDGSYSESLHLDWLSREDGTFLLAVNVGRKVKIYARSPVGLKPDNQAVGTFANSSAADDVGPVIRPMLKRQSTLDVVTRQKLLGARKASSKSIETEHSRHKELFAGADHLLSWSLLSEISLGNSAGLSAMHHDTVVTQKPCPVMVSWGLNGLLLVATETEMHVFCHWLELNQVEKCAPKSAGILYGSASLSQSAPEGLCQHVMKEGLSQGTADLADVSVVSLMSVADMLCPSLPQYHPLVLSELMNGGRLGTVKHILVNLSKMVNGQLESKEELIKTEPLRLRKFGLAMEDESGTLEQKRSITPLLLCDMLSDDGQVNKLSHKFSSVRTSKPPASTSQNKDTVNEHNGYEDLFSTSLPGDTHPGLELDLDYQHAADSPDSIDLTVFEPGYIGPEHCQVLHRYLSRNLLPGLSSLDQMELMAIADTLANAVDTVGLSSSEEQAGLCTDRAGHGYATSGHTGTEAMDDCGLRFVFAMHNHLCLLRSLPAAQRTKLLRQGLDSCHFAWAFHSDAEEEMLSLIASVKRGAPEWDELKSFGVGWWIRSNVTLRRLVEQTARAAFQKDNNPLDAAIFYMALNRKNVLKGLFKTVHEDRMTQFFSQDFSEDRWRRAALKNAFALMGKQRFHEAAAFFLLADCVKDAIEVCIDRMHDIQLASVIVRLRDQEKATVTYTSFLKRYVVGVSTDAPSGDPERKVHCDPFIRSMAYWAIGSYEDALVTLLRKDSQQAEQNSMASITDIFNFYNYLRMHPLIIKQKRIHRGENGDKHLDDAISVDERMLYFATATYHLDAGCPLLTLDVLSTLPPLGKDELDASVFEPSNSEPESKEVAIDFASASSVAPPTDWAEPTFLGSVAPENEDLELDWSESEGSMDENGGEEQESLRPAFTNPAVLNKEPMQEKLVRKKEPAPQLKTSSIDVFVSQLRLTACLRIFVSELKSLVTISNTNGEQLREKLVSLLKKETDVIQRLVAPTASPAKPPASDEGYTRISDAEAEQRSEFSSDSDSDTGSRTTIPQKIEADSVPSLHELYMAEKHDWKRRREMVSHRRRWLKQYRGFLRTLLSYCCLHDDRCGSLSPLRMELLLLLQESLQEKTPHQLSSPLPNPTSIPLLSSTIASCRTVMAEPTSRLSHMAQDILTCILQLSEPPPYPSSDFTVQASTATICRQAEALSYCIYQSLCDTNAQTYRSRMVNGDRCGWSDTHLAAESVASVTASDTQYVPPSTQPSQWPGVSSLRALLSSDDNHPKLIMLLCEALVAVYVSLLTHGLRTCNSFLLYRLVNHQISDKTWRAVFGGGVRVVTRYRPASGNASVGSPSHSVDGKKVRDRLTHKVLSYSHERKGSITSSNSGDTSLYREKFVAPETTLWEYFLSKPLTVSGAEEVGFESDSDMDERDVYSDAGSDELEEAAYTSDDTEDGNPFSYSWHILRLAVVRTASQSLTHFIPKTGLDLSELGTFSPVLNSVLQQLSQWQVTLTKELENFREPPNNFIGGIKAAGLSLRGRPAILKYQAMLDPSNTPFSGSSKNSLGTRRLWHCLVRRENLQEIFIRYIFLKTGNHNEGGGESHAMNPDHPETQNKSSIGSRRATIAVMSPGEERPLRQSRSEAHKNGMGMMDSRLGKVKILHKETEIISSFCINNVKNGLVVLSTNHDVQELDVSALLACDSWSWIEEDVSSSLLQYSEDVPKIKTQKDEDFLVVTRKQSVFGKPSAATSQTSPWTSAMQTGQGASIVLKRAFSGVRRMTSHPSLPYYLTGHHDGSVRMWEWGHQQQISMFRAAGKFPKVTNLHFSPLGNKISAVDTDGYMTLWQVSSPQKPFLCHQCHDRSTSDSCFMSSASVIATAGLSSSNCNIAIWDTLLPPRSMLVKDFHAHEGVGGTCLAYAAEQRTLVVGGRDGKVSIYDIRQPDKFLHCFVAHEAPVKCISLSPDERLFVTGSVVGDVRVWNVSSRVLVHNLGGEHARTSIFRNFGSGTMKVEVTSPGNKVFSCGADGTLKLRALPHDSQNDFGVGQSLSGRIQKLALRRQVVKLASAIKEQTLVY